MIFCLILILFVAGGIYYGVHSYLSQRSWRESAEKGKFDSVKNEPFPGALCLTAIVQSCVNDCTFSAKLIEGIFGKRMDEWNAIAVAVSYAEGLNRDLLVENLVCIIKKQDDKYRTKYIPLILKTLTAAEFMWSDKMQNEKPSEYLTQLLNYTLTIDKKAAAYHVLGLEPDASLDKVKRAHRRLAAKYHPDKNSETGNLEMFLKIQTAFETIDCASRE